MAKDPIIALLEHPWIASCSEAVRKKIGSDEEFRKKVIEYKNIVQSNKPPKGQLMMNIGNEILDMDLFELSRQAYNLSYKDNDSSAVFNNIAYAYSREGNYEKAIEFYKAALAIKPNYDRPINNIASDLVRLAIQYFDEDNVESLNQSEKLLFESLAYKPNHDWAYLNMGNIWERRGQTKKAVYWLESAIQMNPGYTAAQSNVAHAYFKIGEFAKSFEAFEWRSKTDGNPGKIARFTDRTYWDGEEDLAGKSILLHWEQGFGDMIQCVRFLFWFRKKYPTANIILETMEALNPLFYQLQDPKGFVGDVDAECVMPCVNEVLINDRKAYAERKFDFVYPVYSLPRLYFREFGSIPKFDRYLHRPPEKASWVETLNSLRQRKKKIVAINWGGRPSHGNDRYRSTHLSALQDLIDSPELVDCQFVSLQMGEQRAQIKELGLEDKIIDLVDHIKDFCDATNIIGDLDYLISVDSAYLHLAGAIGTKAIGLIAKRSDYRWMLDRTDNIWYPSITLVRQKNDLAWDDAERRQILNIIRGKPQMTGVDKKK
jgi:tetratricopeptide (TPR) repeat protein